MQLQPSQIKNFIIDEDDFGHELRVGKLMADLVSAPLDKSYPVLAQPPAHGGTYIDPALGKPRQFDFRQRIFKSDVSGGVGDKSIFLAVECKNLHQSSPLVICCRERASHEAYHYLVTSEWSAVFSSFDIKKMAGNHTLYPDGRSVGKSLIRPKQDAKGMLKADSQTDIYDRWSQAIASCKELGDAACILGSQNRPVHRSFLMPIVVVPNELLWVAHYEADGNLGSDPTQTDECQFFIEFPLMINVHGPSKKYILTHIHFVTVTGFSNLLGTLTQQARARWEAIFPSYTVD